MDKNKKIIVAVICVIVIAVACILIFRPKAGFDDLKKTYTTAVEELGKLAEDATKEVKDAAQKKVDDAKAALEKAFPDEAKKFFDTEAANKVLADAKAAYEAAVKAVEGIPAESIEAGVQENIDNLKKAFDDAQAAVDALTKPAEEKK